MSKQMKAHDKDAGPVRDSEMYLISEGNNRLFDLSFAKELTEDFS